jgi:lysophospholipase L1-like esterase
MRHWAAVLAAATGILCWFAAPSPAAKPARKRPAPSSVSAAAKAAALRKVDGYIEASTPGAFAQPGALVPVFEQLYRSASAGAHGTAVHMLHFGDSHTAADEFTGAVRDLLKQHFGDGGAGFALAGHPFAGYRRFDLRGGATPNWSTSGLRSANGDGLFGLGGVSITSSRSGQSVFIDAECDRLELDYLQQPGGGSIALYDGTELLDRLSTDGVQRPAFTTYDIGPGAHRFQARTIDSAPVRLFGWVADRTAGVTYEALGINGAEASVMLRWDADMLVTYLQRRNPGLIVLAYGTNEASDPNWPPEAYAQMFSTLLDRLRTAAPAASILVLGPPDRWSRSKGTWRPLPGVDGIIDAQQRACAANACAFWDTRLRMGGKGSMRDWVYAGLAQADYVHFTAAGYRRLAALFFEDIMRGYDSYSAVRRQITGQAPNGYAN